MFVLIILQVDSNLTHFKDFHDDVEPAHWLRLESYASAVRELRVIHDDWYGLGGFVLLLTAGHFQGRPMLPSLVSLTLDNPGLIPTLPLLLSQPLVPFRSATLRIIASVAGCSTPCTKVL